jgi:flavin reductase (DIM6/NTAB) family NADH-FMN oxidoreductase RutF
MINPLTPMSASATSSADATVPVDGALLRDALGRFLTGVTIVTVAGMNQQLYGLTVNSFNSVSLSPPLVLWSLDKRNEKTSLFQKAAGFAVNIMSAAQIDLCERFSGDATDRFAGCGWTPGAFGQPLLDNALVQMECRHWEQYDGGDHLIFVGEVMSVTKADGAPLAFFKGQYGHYDHSA